MRDTTEHPTVLVVEDDVLVRMNIADVLAERGFNVIEAANADQAIRQLERHREIAVLFTDIDMPGSMDGLRLAEAVHDRWPPVKIMVTSGHMSVDAGDLPADGCFLSKPYDPAIVATTLHEMVAA